MGQNMRTGSSRLTLSLLTVLSCQFEVEYAQRLVNIIFGFALKADKNYQKQKTQSAGESGKYMIDTEEKTGKETLTYFIKKACRI